jgi:hypothetical protein
MNADHGTLIGTTQEPSSYLVTETKPNHNTEISSVFRGHKKAFDTLMERLWQDWFGDMDFHPDCVNINLYSDGRESVGWHADDESLFDGKASDAQILSVSLGASREFWIADQGWVREEREERERRAAEAARRLHKHSQGKVTTARKGKKNGSAQQRDFSTDSDDSFVQFGEADDSSVPGTPNQHGRERSLNPQSGSPLSA